MKKVFIVLTGFIILVLLLLVYVFKYNNHDISNRIMVSGNIEATEVRLSFQVEGRIQKLFTDEGMFVKKEQVVAVLNKDELTQIKQQTKAKQEQAKANFDIAQKDYHRFQGLFESGAATARQRDTAQNAYQVAQADLNAATHTYELASIRLGYADLLSNTDAFVLAKNAEAGEVVQPGTTVFTVADLNDIWLTAYINETDLGKVKLNQAAEIKTDTYPDKIYKGRVSFISEQAEFTPKQIQTTQERVKLVYRIKIVIDNPNLELKPGMPADGYIIIE